MPRAEQAHLKRRLAIALAALSCLLLTVPLPYPPTQTDREAIVQLALDGLLHSGLVDTPQGRGAPLRVAVLPNLSTRPRLSLVVPRSILAKRAVLCASLPCVASAA